MENHARRVLLVDDDELNTLALGKRLERRGMQVTVLTDPKRALEFIESNEIELVLLDIVMPEIDGLTVLKEIRTKYGRDELPVIMTTALDDSFDIVNAFNSGANDYIAKPINIDVAVARIHAHLSTVDVYKLNIQRKELDAIKAMITTYNHEINNPLSVALSSLDEDLAKNEQAVVRLKTSLWKISDIVKRIRETDKELVTFEKYAGSEKMVKVK